MCAKKKGSYACVRNARYCENVRECKRKSQSKLTVQHPGTGLKLYNDAYIKANE